MNRLLVPCVILLSFVAPFHHTIGLPLIWLLYIALSTIGLLPFAIDAPPIFGFILPRDVVDCTAVGAVCGFLFGACLFGYVVHRDKLDDCTLGCKVVLFVFLVALTTLFFAVQGFCEGALAAILRALLGYFI